MNLNLNIKDKTINTFILSGKINDEKIINSLINFTKNNEDKELYNATNVKGKFTGFKSGIANKDFHSLLKLIQPAIKVIYQDNFIVSAAWGNILKKGGDKNIRYLNNYSPENLKDIYCTNFDSEILLCKDDTQYLLNYYNDYNYIFDLLKYI